MCVSDEFGVKGSFEIVKVLGKLLVRNNYAKQIYKIPSRNLLLALLFALMRYHNKKAGVKITKL